LGGLNNTEVHYRQRGRYHSLENILPLGPYMYIFKRNLINYRNV